MKIIREGHVAALANKQYRFLCKICQCEFECEESEVEKIPAAQSDVIVSHKCPTCNEVVLGALIVWR